MKADGDWLVIELKAANADFPMYLGDVHAVVVPDGFTDFDKLVGTGPFVLDNFRPGVGMLPKKNPNYHHEGYPHVDEVESFGSEVERGILEARAVRPAHQARERSQGRPGAQGDLLRGAADHVGRGGTHHPAVHPLARCEVHQARRPSQAPGRRG